MSAFAAFALFAACSSTSGLQLPLVGRGRPYAPVEGLEKPELGARARGAVLSGRGEKPIDIRLLPGTERREHPIRGELTALAGPAPDGAFVYAVRDDRPGVALRRANIAGRDDFMARFERGIHALALSPDGTTAAILAPFPDDDERSRGGSLRELVLVDVVHATFEAQGFAALAVTPAWIDASRVACAIPTADGPNEIVIFDARTHSASSVGPGDRVVMDPVGPALLVFARIDGDWAASMVELETTSRSERKVRGLVEPLALLDDGVLLAFSLPTLGAEPQWEFELLGPRVALATIKLHDLATGEFHTVERRASPNRLWSAGRLAQP